MNHFVLRWFHLLDLSSQKGFFLENYECDSEGGIELLFEYPDQNNTGIHSSESCAWICDHLNGLVRATIALIEEEFRISILRLFHSDITAGKKESLKKLCLVLKLEILLLWELLVA